MGCDLNFGKHGKVNVDPKLIHKNIYIDIQIYIYIYLQIVKFIRGAAAVIMCQHDHQNVCFHAGLRVSDMRWCCVRQKNASTKAVGRNNRDSDEFFLEDRKRKSCSSFHCLAEERFVLSLWQEKCIYQHSIGWAGKFIVLVLDMVGSVSKTHRQDEVRIGCFRPNLTCTRRRDS